MKRMHDEDSFVLLLADSAVFTVGQLRQGGEAVEDEGTCRTVFLEKINMYSASQKVSCPS
jgi:hypothetical protein